MNAGNAQALMNQEGAFTDILASARQYMITQDGALVIYAPNSDTLTGRGWLPAAQTQEPLLRPAAFAGRQQDRRHIMKRASSRAALLALTAAAAACAVTPPTISQTGDIDPAYTQPYASNGISPITNAAPSSSRRTLSLPPPRYCSTARFTS